MLGQDISYSIDATTGAYARDRSTVQTRLQDALQEIYTVPHVEMLCSGMSAIYATLDSLALHFGKGIFLIAEHVYSEIHPKIIKQLRRYHPKIRFVKVDIYQAPASVFADAKVLYLESCSNPNGYVFDSNRYIDLPPTAYVVVDNTWLSPVVYNPFEHGAHIVVESTAKYLSGGRCIMGLVGFKRPEDPVAKLLKQYIKATGVHVNPIYCEIVLTSLSTLKTRIQNSYRRTLHLLTYLRTVPRVDIIHHPSSFETPFYELGPSVIYFHLQIDPEVLRLISDHRSYVGSASLTSKIMFRTSFGHPYDAIDYWVKRDSTGLWIRFAVGYEDDLEITHKLRHLFDLL